MERKKSITKHFKQLLYPTRCPVCDGVVVPYGEKICLNCMKQLKLLTPPWCMKCGKKLEEEKEFCRDCSKKQHFFVRGRALYEYGSVARSIYRMKYGGRQEYAEYFGEEMAEYLREFICQVRPDGIIPVPLHKKRENQRGYNQAALLARELGRQMNIPVYERVLLRVKNTKPLKLQNSKERQNNLKKAFIMAENDVKLNTILIVDDIYTTGSTVNEMAQVFKENGVEKIYFVALACGEGI